MQDWESMIAERKAMHGTVVTCRIQDPRRRNRQAYDRRHDKTPKRIAQHKEWAKTPAGKKSMHKRWRNDEGFDYARSHRHMNKWLELAEKFKPNNSTAQ